MTDKTVPDPPACTLRPAPGQPPITLEDQLNHAWDLLRCANATAWQCGDTSRGQPRDLAMATTHLITLAQGVIGHMIDHLPATPQDGAPRDP